MQRSSEATVSGLFLFFALISIIPFLKQLKEYFKSPSAYVVWIILFSIFIVLRNIIDEMVIVCFIGMVANILGAVIYNIGRHIEGEGNNS